MLSKTFLIIEAAKQKKIKIKIKIKKDNETLKYRSDAFLILNLNSLCRQTGGAKTCEPQQK